MTADSLRRIQAARHQSVLLHVEAYCRSSDCAAREIHIHVKDYDDEFVSRLRRRGLTCPVCGCALAMHWVMTAAQHEAVEDVEARRSVSRQMYVRDHCQRGLACYPLSVLRDALPPTPTGWFDHAADGKPEGGHVV